MSEPCLKTEIINDLKDRIEKLEDNDRQGYGIIKELTFHIKTIAENTEKQSKTIIETGKTMVSMKENLDNLNEDNKLIKNDIDELKEKVNAQNIEAKNQSEIKVSKIQSKAVVIGAFITGSLGLLSAIAVTIITLIKS